MKKLTLVPMVFLMTFGVFALQAGPVLANVQVDQHGDLNSSRRSSALEFADIQRMVHHDHRFRRLRHDAHQPRDLWLTDHLARDQEPANTRAHHHFGFRYCRRADADGAFFELLPRDVHTLVGL